MCYCLYVLLSPVFVVAGCNRGLGTGTVRVLLLVMRDISCKVILSLSIGSFSKIVFTFSVSVFCGSVLLSLLAIDIV